MKTPGLTALIQECIREVLAEGRRICAWCKKDMGEYAGNGDTHGICPDCFKKQLEDIPKSSQKPNKP